MNFAFPRKCLIPRSCIRCCEVMDTRKPNNSFMILGVLGNHM